MRGVLQTISVLGLIVGAVLALLAAGRGVTPGVTRTATTGDGISNLKISEFMASNTAGLSGASGGRHDWIEIHNPTTEPVDLEGWSLTNGRSDTTLWPFPDARIEPGGYLVGFASGLNQADSLGACATER